MSRPEILYEDNHLLVLNKRPGDLVQGDSTGDPSVLDTIKRFIKKRDNKPGNVFLGLPHRLDRPVSGVVVLAKTSKALSRLSSGFREGKVEKTYWAVVETTPNILATTLTHHLLKDAKRNRSRVVPPGTPGAKEARLAYRLVGTSERYAFLEVDLITGRHHQIRAQLSVVGSPVKGDLKYGAKRSDPGGGIHLHARRLVLAHPVGGRSITFVAPPPRGSLWDLFPPEVETGSTDS